MDNFSVRQNLQIIEKEEENKAISGQIEIKRSTYNQNVVKIDQQVDEENANQLLIRMFPQEDGNFWLHIFFGEQEIKTSPIQVQIIKSEEHLRLEEAENAERDRMAALREE